MTAEREGTGDGPTQGQINHALWMAENNKDSCPDHPAWCADNFPEKVLAAALKAERERADRSDGNAKTIMDKFFFEKQRAERLTASLDECANELQDAMLHLQSRDVPDEQTKGRWLKALTAAQALIEEK